MSKVFINSINAQRDMFSKYLNTLIKFRVSYGKNSVFNSGKPITISWIDSKL